MAELKWSPPQDRRHRASPELFDHAQKLRANPGKWGIIAEGLNATRTQASSFSLGVRRGKYAAFQPPGAWLSRSSGDKVWACFIGEDGEYVELAQRGSETTTEQS